MNIPVALVLIAGIGFSQVSYGYSGLMLNPPQPSHSSSSGGGSWNPGNGKAPWTFDQAYDIPVSRHPSRPHKNYLCGDHCEPGEGEALEAENAYVSRQYKNRQAHGNQVCRQFIQIIRNDAAQAGFAFGRIEGEHCNADGSVGFNVETSQGVCTLITNTASADRGEASARLLCNENVYGQYPSVLWQKSYGRFGFNSVDREIDRGSRAVFNKTQKRHSR